MSETTEQGARGVSLRVPALATAACLLALVAAQVFMPGIFAAYATLAALAAIVALGLPHGVLDIRAVSSAFRLGRKATLAVLGLYLAVAGGTAALWVLSPVIALLAFLVVATVHFSEDWAAPGPSAFSLAVPAALFCAGAIRDRDAYDVIFTAMTGTNAAALATDALVTLAPLAHGGAIVAVVLMVRGGEGWRALAAVASVSATWVLPPVAGFAVYFAVFHSPLHMREMLAAIGVRREGAALEGAATFALALGLVCAVALLIEPSIGFPVVGSAVFIALAILTVPHMIVPSLVGSVVAGRFPMPAPR